MTHISHPTSHNADLPDDVVLSVRGVSKKFCRNLRRSMAYGIKDLSCNLLGIRQDTSELRRDEFWALKNIDFEVKRGESVGVIGVNGCGKTTLFRLIHGIFPPDCGDILVRGRVGALIALGAGFHPHMTGRENIYLNGTILGMSREEVEDRIHNIVEFSEIGEFIDAPVSTYSSGMRVRLGFAVAIHIEPDILLTDEVLAVGDLAFRNKCLRHMRKMRDSKCTILLVSHNMPHITKVCDRAILLDRGGIVSDGPAEVVVAEYYRRAGGMELQRHATETVRSAVPPQFAADGEVFYHGASILDKAGTVLQEIPFGSDVTFQLDVEVLKPVGKPIVSISFRSAISEERVAFARVELNQTCHLGRYLLRCSIVAFSIQPGTYILGSRVTHEDRVAKIAGSDRLLVFNVVPRAYQRPKDNRSGYFEIAGEWKSEQVDHDAPRQEDRRAREDHASE